MPERDLRAAPCRIAGRGKREVGTVVLDQFDEKLGQFDGFRADLVDIGPVPDVHRGVQCGHLQDRRRADAHPLDPVTGAVIEVEGKGRFMAEPAGKGGADAIGMVGRDIDEGRARRARN